MSARAEGRPKAKLVESSRARRHIFLLQNIRSVSKWGACAQSLTINVGRIVRKSHNQGGGNLKRCTMTNTRAKPSNSRGEYPRGPQPDPATWGEPEQVNPKNVLVEGDRLPVDEDIVAALMATINTGNGKVLPPIHLWEKQPGSDLILVAGRNRLEAHKRSEHSISARIIRGDTREIVRAVKLCEIEENFNRRKLSPALRKMYTAQLKVFYEEQHPETKAGKAGGLGKARKSAVPRSGTAPAFTKAHAKRTGRSPSAVAQDAAEAKTLGDETLQRIAGTSLDTPSEITALAAMDEQERQQIIERAVAGEAVSALKPERMSEESKTRPSSAYKLASGLAAVPTPALQNKLNQVVHCRADLPAKERRLLAGALRAVAKRFEQIADKIDIDETPEMTSISPDAPGAAR